MNLVKQISARFFHNGEESSLLLSEAKKFFFAAVRPWRSIAIPQEMFGLLWEALLAERLSEKEIAAAFKLQSEFNQYRVEYDQSSARESRPGHLELAWRDGQLYIALRATCGRWVEFEKGPQAFYVKVSFGRNGSAASAAEVLRRLVAAGFEVDRWEGGVEVSVEMTEHDPGKEWSFATALEAVRDLPSGQFR